MRLLDSFLRHPHYPTGNVLAKQSTNCATLLWSTLVLANDNAIGPTGYAEVARYIHEDAIAAVLFVISLVQLVWIIAKWRPIAWRSLGYLVQCGWWFLIFALIAQQRPPQVTALTGTALIAVLAAFAFTSGERRDDGGGDGVAP